MNSGCSRQIAGLWCLQIAVGKLSSAIKFVIRTILNSKLENFTKSTNFLTDLGNSDRMSPRSNILQLCCNGVRRGLWTVLSAEAETLKMSPVFTVVCRLSNKLKFIRGSMWNLISRSPAFLILMSQSGGGFLSCLRATTVGRWNQLIMTSLPQILNYISKSWGGISQAYQPTYSAFLAPTGNSLKKRIGEFPS